MLGNTLAMNMGSVATPDVKTLSKINQDGYSSEYRLAEDGEKITAFIRHSTEKNKVNGATMDRHQVLLRRETAPTDTYPQGQLFEAYVIVRAPNYSSAADIQGVLVGASLFSAYAANNLVNWES